MGDRANAVILDQWEKDEPKPVYLYTHWSGTELPETVRQALMREVRWDDDSYLARIVFDQMIGSDQGEETGFGISTSPPDGANRLIVLYKERVYRSGGPQGLAMILAGEMDNSISFRDYIATERTWDNLTSEVQPAE